MAAAAVSGTLIAAIVGPFAPLLGVAAAWLNLRANQAKNHAEMKDRITEAVKAAAVLPAREISGEGNAAGRCSVQVTIHDTGGWLSPGLSVAVNGTGQPERAVAGPGDAP